MQIQSEIVEKYNTLFDIVVSYYNSRSLESKVMLFSSGDVKKLKHIKVIVNHKECHTLKEQLQWLSDNGYGLLEPFQIFSWFLMNSHENFILPINFRRMNDAVKEVLKNKEIIERTLNNGTR